MMLPHLSIFEALMLILFGISWPFALLKTYRSKSTKGKSLSFLFFILLGYLCGIIHKILHSLDLVILLYIINFVMVALDTVMYFKYRNLAQNK